MAYYKIRAKSDEESQLVQHVLFKKGYYWTNKGQPQNVHRANPPYIFVEDDGQLQWDDDSLFYSECHYPEVRVDQIESTIPNINSSHESTHIQNKQKGSNMKNLLSNVADQNKQAATNAALLEAGRIANNELSKLAAKQLPMMVRGYADSPVGKLVIANIASIALQQFRPNDSKLKHLSDAMLSAAFQEAIQTLNIDKLISDFTENSKIQSALDKLTDIS